MKHFATNTFGQKADLSRDLALLHHICIDHLHELQALSTKKVSVDYGLFILVNLDLICVTH